MYGQWLRELRQFRNLTQAELAERAQTTQASISDIERGTVQTPGTALLQRLARALEVSEQDLRGALFANIQPSVLERITMHCSNETINPPTPAAPAPRSRTEIWVRHQMEQLGRALVNYYTKGQDLIPSDDTPAGYVTAQIASDMQHLPTLTYPADVAVVFARWEVYLLDPQLRYPQLSYLYRGITSQARELRALLLPPHPASPSTPPIYQAAALDGILTELTFIDSLPLSTRTSNWLKRNGIYTVNSLVQWDVAEFERQSQVGPYTTREIIRVLQDWWPTQLRRFPATIADDSPAPPPAPADPPLPGQQMLPTWEVTTAVTVVEILKRIPPIRQQQALRILQVLATPDAQNQQAILSR